MSALLALGCGQSTEDPSGQDRADAGPDTVLDGGMDATLDTGVFDAGFDSAVPECPERAPMLENMDVCSSGAFCEYDESIPSDEICRTVVAFCPSTGEPWQQRLFQRCSSTPSSDEGSWSGILILLFVETTGACGPLGRYEYQLDQNRLDEFLCEVTSRDSTGTNVTEVLRCTHESLELSLDASLAVTWTGKFWEGTAEISLFSESLQVDCTSTYGVRAEGP